MTKLHKQPSPEELQAQIDEAVAIPEEELPTEPAIEEETESPEVPETPEEPVKEPEPEPQAEPSKELFKKKFSESSKEAQKLYAKNRVINKALIEAEETPEPTEEELVKEYPDWDVMSETERKFAKETVISRHWRKTIAQAKEQATKIEKWNDSVDEFVENPQTLIDNPELEGKTEEFQEFAKREESNSVPFKYLIGAFLHQHSVKPVNKGAMFPTGSGGPNDKPQPHSDKISLEEARILREKDYGKYKEYLIAGRIEIDL